MKLLLTSAGVNNSTIRDALVDLLGKPIADSTPCASPPRCTGTPTSVQGEGSGSSSAEFRPTHGRAGLEVLGVLELTALPSIDEERWVPLVREADVLLVAGGDALYLSTGCGSPGWPTCCLR